MGREPQEGTDPLHPPLLSSPPRKKEVKPEPLGCAQMWVHMALGGSARTCMQVWAQANPLSTTPNPRLLLVVMAAETGARATQQGPRLGTVVLARGWRPKLMGH